MNKKGFTLIETIVYIAVVAVVALSFGGMVLAVARSYSRLSVVRSLDVAGTSAMDRMTRTIRSASSIDLAGSTLGSSPGVLSLNIVGSNGVSSKTSFQVSGQNLQIKVAGIDQGTLLPSEVTVGKLLFNSITSSSSQAVKLELQLTAKFGSASSTQTYYDTAILRGSYQ